MKSHSYHFIFKNGSDYKDLVPIFPDILKIILRENDHFQNDEDEESREMFVDINLNDLKQNRKPEGYNRKGKFRLIFPMDRKEFYLRSVTAKPSELKRVGTIISDILATADVKFDITVDDNTDFD